MIHAALDTSLAAAFALAEDGRILANCALAKQGRDSDEFLVPWLMETLQGLGLNLADIRQWSVGTGPGSFSGIRVGISWVLGVCAATGAGVRGVPSSLALARAIAIQTGDVAVLHDARRSQLILSPYRIGPAGPVATAEPCVVTPTDLLAQAAGYGAFVTAQGPVAELLAGQLGERLEVRDGIDARELLAVSDIPWPTSPAETTASLEPVYVRPAVFVKPRPVVSR